MWYKEKKKKQGCWAWKAGNLQNIKAICLELHKRPNHSAWKGKKWLYLAGIIIHGSPCVDFNKHRYSEGRGWRLLLSSVCSALTLRPQSQLHSRLLYQHLCPMMLPNAAPCFCALIKTQHTEVNLCATATWKQVSQYSLWSQTLFNLSPRLSDDLNYALILAQRRVFSASWHKCLPFFFAKKEEAVTS